MYHSYYRISNDFYMEDYNFTLIIYSITLNDINQLIIINKNIVL